MEQGYSWEAKCFLAVQEILAFYETQGFISVLIRACLVSDRTIDQYGHYSA
jgi:hypothetical protein